MRGGMGAGRVFQVFAVQAILALSVLGCLPWPAGAQGGRDGPRAEVLIHDVYELQNMSMDLNGSYVLANDINAFATAKWNDGKGFKTIGNGTASSFKGKLEGNGYTISDLYIWRRTETFAGLFGYMDVSAIISNFTMSRFSIAGSSQVGGLAGTNYGAISNCSCTGALEINGAGSSGGFVGTNAGTISECHVAGSINLEGGFCGGLAGQNIQNGKISNCYIYGSVSGIIILGGLVGNNTGTISDCNIAGSVKGGDGVGGIVANGFGTISNCSSSGNVSGNGRVGGIAAFSGNLMSCYNKANVTSTGDTVGGIIGSNSGGMVSECYNVGSVTGKNQVGGLIGCNIGKISKCYNLGPVIGTDEVGGLAGENSNGYDQRGIITDCYNIGLVTGRNKVGGLVGYHFFIDPGYGTGAANITHCYNAGLVQGTTNTSCLVGKSGAYIVDCYWNNETSSNVTSDNGTGKNTTHMRLKATFVGWDFTEIWNINETMTYPYLRSLPAPVANSPPAIITLPVTTVTVDSIYAIQYRATDADGDDLSWHMITNASWLNMTSTGRISGTPSNNDIGIYHIVITVSDGKGGAAYKTFELTVSARQHWPYWSLVPPDTILTEGDDYNFTAKAEDVEPGDTVTYKMSSVPDCGLSINATSGSIRWSNVSIGSYACRLNASDGHGYITYYFNLTVVAKPPPGNRPPEIISVTAPNNTKVSSSTALKFSADAVDADGDNLTYDWQENGVTLSRERSFSRKFPQGDHQLMLFIGDGQHLTTSTFNFTVVLPPERIDAGPLFVPGLGQGLAAAGVVALVAIGLFGAGTEVGKYQLILLFLPLYTRIHRDEVLDSETRGLIRGCIISDPGIHYKEIARRCNLGNGAAVHHLNTLEREGIIRSQNDGRFRRFYPAEMRFSEVPPKLTKLQKVIFEVVREREGMSQLEIAGLLEASYPTVHRHINRMAEMGVLRLERHGMTVKCYIANGQKQDVNRSPAGEQNTG